MIAVELDKLTVKFGDFTAVNELTLSVEQGEIFGFLGANGAGKTTAIRVMCGLLLPTSGDVRIAGLDFSHGKDAIKRKVGYMSQKFTLYDDLTVIENLNFKAAISQTVKRILISLRSKAIRKNYKQAPPLDFRDKVVKHLSKLGFAAGLCLLECIKQNAQMAGC